MKKIFVSLIITAAIFISLLLPGTIILVYKIFLSSNMIENGQNFYRNVSLFLNWIPNEQYKYIRDGIVLQDGQLKLVRNGNLYRQV